MSDTKEQHPYFDTSTFTNDPYVKRVEKPWGYELHLAPVGTPYMLKLLHIDAGMRLSLQLHDEKLESWTIVRGDAKVAWSNAAGELIETTLEPNVGYSTHSGQKHRLIAITDADIIEASTPELGTTWRLEDDFERPHETPEQRKLERGE